MVSDKMKMAYKCVICYKNLERKGSINNSADISDSGNDCKTIKDQLSVIFFLRKFINVPQDICMKLLKEHGHPSLWISWCHSCSTLVEKAKGVFHQLELLQNQAKELKTELQNAVLSAELEKCSTKLRVGEERFSEDFSTEVVRSYILLESDFTLTEGRGCALEESKTCVDVDRTSPEVNISHTTICLAGSDKILYDEDEAMTYVTKIEVDDENLNSRNMKTASPQIRVVNKSANSETPTVSLSTNMIIDDMPNQTNRNYSKNVKKTHKGIQKFHQGDIDQFSKNNNYTNGNLVQRSEQTTIRRRRRSLQLEETRSYCKLCKKFFKTRVGYRNHWKANHIGIPIPRHKWSCPTCGLKTRDIDAHTKTHDPNREFFHCTECNRKFTTQANVTRHRKSSHFS